MKLISKTLTYFGLIALVFLLGNFFHWLLDQIISLLNLEINQWTIIITLISVMFLGLAVSILTSKLSEKDNQASIFFDVYEKKKEVQLKGFELSINSSKGENKTILCMSGGGMKAGLFHLGGLKELNARGILSQIDTFSSVSGGSITNAWLASNWEKLNFDEMGIATNFEDVVFKPLFQYFTEVSVNMIDIISGMLPFSTVAKKLTNSFDRNLFKGARLSNIVNPQNGPNFYIVSTDLRTNTAWYFSRDEIGALTKNYKLGDTNQDFTLGQAVTASAAFPPYISPYVLKLSAPINPSKKFKELSIKDAKLSEKFSRKLILGDGGIYDNLAVEKAKGHNLIFVSNSGSPFSIIPEFPRNWMSQFSAIATRVHRQVEQRRKIHLGDLSALKQIDLHLWEIDDVMDDETSAKYDGLKFSIAWEVSTYKVRLSRTPEDIAKKIIKHGESLARRELLIAKRTN